MDGETMDLYTNPLEDYWAKSTKKTTAVLLSGCVPTRLYRQLGDPGWTIVSDEH